MWKKGFLMSAPQQQKKVLKIGIIQGGRIIEERVVKPGETVTIGDDHGNTFQLPSSGLPKKFSMFVAKGQQYMLAFNQDMDGKLSMDGGVVMGMDGVREKSTKQKDGSWHFPLTEQIRGKVTIAGTTILFQFVPMPAAPPKNAQGEFSSSWVKTLDTPYWSIFGVSAMMHALVILYAMQLPVPEPMTLEDMPDRFAQIIVPQKPKVEEVKKEEKGEGEDKKEEKAEKKEDKGDSEKKEAKKSEPAPQISEEQRKAAKKAAVAKTGLLAVLGARMASGDGGAFGAIIKGDSSGGMDLEGMIRSNPGAMQVVAGGPGIKGGQGDGSLIGVEGDVGQTGADAGVKVAQREKKAVPKVSAEAAEVKGGDAQSVEAVIAKQKGAIIGCYESLLKLNPEAKGKLTLTFVIEPTGRVSEVTPKVTGFQDDTFEQCVKDRVKRWKFKMEDQEDPVDVTTSYVLSH